MCYEDVLERVYYEGVSYRYVDRVCHIGVCSLTSISTVLASNESCRYTTVRMLRPSSVSPSPCPCADWASPGPWPVASETRASALLLAS